MSNVTASMVKELRERTGVGMGKCKEALDQAKGDMETAIDILRKSGMASAVKKEARETKEGLILAQEDSKAVAILEMNAETDFVVKNESFQEMVETFCKEALIHHPADAEAFLNCKTKKGMTVNECRAEAIQRLGENMRLRRVVVWKKGPASSIGIYSHMGGKILSVVEIEGDSNQGEFARAIAMHAAAEFPEYLVPQDIPADVLSREEEIAKAQVGNKPANIQQKIVEGKMNAFFDQVCLTRQKYIRQPEKTVNQVVEAEGKKIGKTLKIKRFIRWQVGV